MTEQEYWGAVKALGLTQTKVATVFLDADGMTHNVPDPVKLPPDVRAGVIRRLRESLGVAERQ